MPRLEFKGKSFVWNHHLAVPYHELIPVPEKSVLKPRVEAEDAAGGFVPPSLHDNLIIHGDNLKVLKALLPTYAGKIKCIYIDPPYNTGNEGWKYNDNVNSPYIKEWLGKVVDKEDLTRHDKWLCMMTPRLKVLRDLLSEDGVIFVSIDDNESCGLEMLMLDLFGEDNFLGKLVWDLGTGTAAGNFTRAHEYLITFAKNKNQISNFRYTGKEARISERAVKKISKGNPISKITFPAGIEFEGENAIFKGTFGKSEKIRVIDDEMQFSNGKLTFQVTLEAGWAMRDQILSWIAGSKTYDSKGQLVTKFFFDRKGVLQYEKIRGFVNPQSVLRGIASTRKGSAILEEVLGKTGMEFPKPVELVKYLTGLVTEPDSIILDSFAGSGTTAHAVLALNKEDGGNRKFILVECEDYADTITAERVRRVIAGVPTAKDPNLKAGLGGTFSYYELGKALDVEGILSARSLPTYESLGRYVFQTATGVPLDLSKIDESRFYLGSLAERDVYMIYRADVDFLKKEALTLEFAQGLPPHENRVRLVFGPQKFLDDEFCREYHIEFQQLPYEIHRFRE